MLKSLTMLILAILACIPAWSASLTIVHPNGDEELLLGMATPITWNAAGVNQKIKLLLVKSGGAIIGTIASDLDAGSQSYIWSAGDFQGGIAAAGSNYKIRIKAIGTTLQDESDKAFSLFAGSPPSQQGQVLQLASPNGGEKWPLGTKKAITWQSVGVNGTVKLEILSHPGLAPLGLVADHMPATGSMIWEWGRHAGGFVPSGQSYVMRVTSESTPTISDTSDAPFMVDPLHLVQTIKLDKKPILKNSGIFIPITITSPQANGQYTAGKPLPIAWNKNFGFSADIRMVLLDDQGAELEQRFPLANTGSYDGWTPDLKYTWPGIKFRIRLEAVNPGNNKVSTGQSGLFSIAPPPVLKKVTRTIARNGTTATTQTRQYNDEGMADCLGASHPTPGRAPGTREIKVGHHVASGRHGECDWYEAYYFKGNVTFDLDEIKGKEIVEARLLVSLSEFREQGPQGTLATNEECDSNCDVYVKDSNFPGGRLAGFSLFAVSEKISLDVFPAVKHWAAGNPNNGLLFQAKLAGSNYSESVCLKYYGTMFLTVTYIDYE